MERWKEGTDLEYILEVELAGLIEISDMVTEGRIQIKEAEL